VAGSVALLFEMFQPPRSSKLVLLARKASRAPTPSNSPSLKNVSFRNIAHVRFRVVSIFGGKRTRAQSGRAVTEVLVIRVALTEPLGIPKALSRAAKNASSSELLNAGRAMTPRELIGGAIGSGSCTTALAVLVTQPRRAPRLSLKGREHVAER
jgi:hypothetical protein